VETTVDHINERAGSQFDPEVVAAFNKALPKMLRVMANYSAAVEDPEERIAMIA
jgi:HD-GYP domain-containing protein (c-di-GMP phosphodiesterase class II)